MKRNLVRERYHKVKIDPSMIRQAAQQRAAMLEHARQQREAEEYEENLNLIDFYALQQHKQHEAQTANSNGIKTEKPKCSVKAEVVVVVDDSLHHHDDNDAAEDAEEDEEGDAAGVSTSRNPSRRPLRATTSEAGGAPPSEDGVHVIVAEEGEGEAHQQLIVVKSNKKAKSEAAASAAQASSTAQLDDTNDAAASSLVKKEKKTPPAPTVKFLRDEAASQKHHAAQIDCIPIHRTNTGTATLTAQPLPMLTRLFSATIARVTDKLRAIEDEELNAVAVMDGELEECVDRQRAEGEARLRALGIVRRPKRKNRRVETKPQNNTNNSNSAAVGAQGEVFGQEEDDKEEVFDPFANMFPNDEDNDGTSVVGKKRGRANAQDDDYNEEEGGFFPNPLEALITAAAPNDEEEDDEAFLAPLEESEGERYDDSGAFKDLGEAVEHQLAEARAAIAAVYPLGSNVMRSQNGGALLLDLPRVWATKLEALCAPDSWLSQLYRATPPTTNTTSATASASDDTPLPSAGKGQRREGAKQKAAALAAAAAQSEEEGTDLTINSTCNGPLFCASPMDATVSLINTLLAKQQQKKKKNGGGVVSSAAATSRAGEEGEDASGGNLSLASASANALQPTLMPTLSPTAQWIANLAAKSNGNNSLKEGAAGGEASSAASVLSPLQRFLSRVRGEPESAADSAASTINETTSLPATQQHSRTVRNSRNNNDGGDGCSVEQNTQSANALASPSLSRPKRQEDSIQSRLNSFVLEDGKMPIAGTTVEFLLPFLPISSASVAVNETSSSSFPTTTTTQHAHAASSLLPLLAEERRVLSSYFWPSHAPETDTRIASTSVVSSAAVVDSNAAAAAAVGKANQTAQQLKLMSAGSADFTDSSSSHLPTITIPPPMRVSRIQGGAVNISKGNGTLEIRGGSLVSLVPPYGSTCSSTSTASTGPTSASSLPFTRVGNRIVYNLVDNGRSGSSALPSAPAGELAVGLISIPIPLCGRFACGDDGNADGLGEANAQAISDVV